MKKTLLFALSICLLVTVFGAGGYRITSAPMAKDVFVPIGQGKKISLSELATIKVKDFEILSGRHLRFFDRIAFKIAQKEMRASINADGTVNNDAFSKPVRKHGAHRPNPYRKFHAGGFFLGFLLNVIGIAIALSFKDSKRGARLNWALIGAGVFVLVLVIMVFL